MTQISPLDAEKNHLSGLLEAIQRCVYFLDASSQTLQWPITGSHLAYNKKDKELFEIVSKYKEYTANPFHNYEIKKCALFLYKQLVEFGYVSIEQKIYKLAWDGL